MIANANTLSAVSGADETWGIYSDKPLTVKGYNSSAINKNGDIFLSSAEIQAVEELEIANTYISSLEGIEYFYNLKMLQCANNKLTTLDMTNSKQLNKLFCLDNQIKDELMDALIASLPTGTDGSLYVIDEDYGLEHNVCTAQQVAAAEEKGWTVIFLAGHMWRSNYPGSDMGVAIGVTNFPDDNFRNYVASKQIDLNEDGYLSEAELAAVTNMPIINRSIENLKGVEFFTELTGLQCHNNKLQSLDVSKNTKLETLNCYGNKLSSLDLSANTSLKYLACHNNGMTSLKLPTSATALTQVYCYGNKLEGEAMDKLVNGLPTVSELSACLMLVNADDITPDNIITAAQVKVATDKNWIVKKSHNSETDSSVYYAGQGDTNGDNNIDEEDLSLIEDIIMGQQPEGISKLAGDLNNDGKVDAADIVIMVNILNGK